ncbi:uncharacterized protein PAC_15671 [Phialocephala subalpina]|uniref:C3H1-type domain-containing protein n=1 Tax=Phialocephala subalpina TaxID=576137 RepID=A0A1L7XL31_9HELO|nr:uncharacterized protein PAC_15671 [Phialocephala subalpina]
MSNNSLSQFDSAASVEVLEAHFAQLAKQDQERSELTSGVLKRLYSYEQEIHRLKMDLEDQTKSRMIYQQEARILEEQKRKIEQLIDKDPYVVVLVDGDGSKLKQEIKDYLKDTPLGAVNLPILVRVFANLNDLARSLRLSNVIESADDMRTFAEQFTNSRAEFDFINVGRGKENADSKMRSCHDNGYLHDLREHVGDPDAKERIVLLETTQRNQVLLEKSTVDGDSRGPPELSPTHQPPESLVTMTPPDGTGSPSPMLSAASLAASSVQLSTPTANVSTSGNGGISIKYPSSYAAAGGASGHQNITLQAAKTKNPKTIEYNKDHHRLDPPIKNPGFNNPSQATYKAKADRVKPTAFCNHHYLAGNCKLGDECERDHSTKLTPGEVAIHRYRARTSVCPAGPACDDYSCSLSHHCLHDPRCNRVDCKFKNTRYGDLHLSKEDLVAATRWTEGISFPTAF